MDIEEFCSSGAPRWNRLERLLDRVEAASSTLDIQGLEELVGLYRQACSDLNRARSLTASPDVLDPLNRLVGRGYRFLYGRAPRGAWRKDVAVFFSATVPRAFRRRRGLMLQATIALLLGALVGLVGVLVHPPNAELLIPPMFFTESPRERVEKIESGEERIDSLDEALTFGATLYTHNIRVGFLAFSLAALTVIGAHLLLFHNGVILGAVAASYHADGVQRFFIAWVGPHGALELPAIVFSAAAGLVLGNALLFPGDLSRAAALRTAAPDSWRILATAIAAFLAAGLIEGSFSQFTGRTVPLDLKIVVALILFACLACWLFFAGRRSGASA